MSYEKGNIIIDSEPVSWHCIGCGGSRNHLFNVKTVSYSLCCECGRIAILTEQVEKIKGMKIKENEKKEKREKEVKK